MSQATRRAGNKKGRAPERAAAPQPLSFFDRLSPELYLHFMTSLSKLLPCRDRDLLRRASKGVRETLISSMRWLDVPPRADYSARDPAAFIRLLQHATGLRGLSLRTVHLMDSDAERLLVEGIGNGRVGVELRCLEVRDLGDAQLPALVRHLKDGKLRYLQGLQLPWLDDASGSVGAVVADMVEARKLLREQQQAKLAAQLPGQGEETEEDWWPALTRLEGIASFQPASLQRIWACCEPSTVGHLEACCGPQLKALGEYMKEVAAGSRRAAFKSLGIMHLGGCREEDGDEQQHALVEAAGIFEVLRQGHAPALFELKFSGWTPAMGSTAALGEAVGRSKLQMYDLTLHRCQFRPADFRAMVDGIWAASNPLVSLSLDDVRLTEAELDHLVDTMTRGGGWSQLEILRLRNVRVTDPEDPTYQMDSIPLAISGFPCSETLRTLVFYQCEFDLNTFRIFVEDCLSYFPNLEHLEGDFASERYRITCLIDSSLNRVEPLVDDDEGYEADDDSDTSESTDGPDPWLLEHLTVHTDGDLILWVSQLAKVFEAGALPNLRTLNITAPPLTFFHGMFFDSWKDLGDSINLERLGLGFDMSEEVARQILEAFKDPRLCPSLVAINHTPASMRIEDVEAMFEERRRTREAAS